MTPSYLQVQCFEDLRPFDVIEGEKWIRGMFWVRNGSKVIDRLVELSDFRLMETTCLHGHAWQIPIWHGSTRRTILPNVHFPMQVCRGMIPPANGPLEELEVFRDHYRGMMERVLSDTFDINTILAIHARDDLEVIVYDTMDFPPKH